MVNVNKELLEELFDLAIREAINKFYEYPQGKADELLELRGKYFKE